ncbi:ArnT family glycosyltransferase [Persephonella sp.]
MSGKNNAPDGNRQGIQPNRLKKLFIFAVLLSIVSLFAGSFNYRFRGEEPTRVVMAYEMAYQGQFAQPTYLGENYYRKPPLFNWLAVGSSKIWGWNQFTGRFVSIVSTVTVVLLIFILAYRFVFRDIFFSLVSSAVFLGFIDVLFWYGFLSEIDMALTLLVFGTIISLIFAFEYRSVLLFSIAGFITGLSFLMKGFPAPVFFLASYAGIFVGRLFLWREFSWKFVYGFFVAIVFAFIPVVLWLYALPEPEKYISVLWQESFGRVKQSTDIVQFFTHLLMFPLLNLKQTLLISVFFLVSVVMYKNSLKRNIFTKEVVLLAVVFFINYLPYWISAGARGRYILPILPILAILIVYFIKSMNKPKLLKFLAYLLVFTAMVRIGIGLFYFPLETKKKGLYRQIAADMVKQMNPDYYGYMASDCDTHKAIIFYIDSFTGSMVRSEKLLPKWKYFISCYKQPQATLLKTYNYKGQKIRLYYRE